MEDLLFWSNDEDEALLDLLQRIGLVRSGGGDQAVAGADPGLFTLALTEVGV